MSVFQFFSKWCVIIYSIYFERLLLSFLVYIGDVPWLYIYFFSHYYNKVDKIYQTKYCYKLPLLLICNLKKDFCIKIVNTGFSFSLFAYFIFVSHNIKKLNKDIE